MGGQNTFLHAGVDGSTYEGIVLNPMQQSEPSKVAIFTCADYAWKCWKDEAEGDQAHEEKAGEDRGGGQSDVATSRGRPAAARRWKILP